MKTSQLFDAIVIGGSYAGLSAAMSMGRALMRVLIIDSGKPCNLPTPHAHNFLTHDGHSPEEISNLAKQQPRKYETVTFFNGLAVDAKKTADGFEIQVASGEIFAGRKLIFATGIKDLLPSIGGISACWGISVLHCPYCHGYEVRHQKTGIIGNGEAAFEFSKMISNWTNDLTLFTNGKSNLMTTQISILQKHQIKIEEKAIESLEHDNGFVSHIVFKDGSKSDLKAIYSPSPFEQHCPVPKALGCELTPEGYIKTDAFQETTIEGVFACGDNTVRMRSIANAIAMGNFTGAAVSKKVIFERF